MQEHGWGYFPSLAALQFQGAIPPPSASVALFEQEAKKHINMVLKTIAFFVALLFLLS